MRRILLPLALFFICVNASADMVEIKGEGFYNGTIESEDQDQVTFKDASGKVRAVAKKDITFLERQTEAPPEKKALLKAGQVLKKTVAEKTPVTKSPSSAVKKKATPANKKESTGGDATGALRAIARAQKAVDANNARAEKALREGDSLEEKKKDPKKGRFSSL